MPQERQSSSPVRRVVEVAHQARQGRWKEILIPMLTGIPAADLRLESIATQRRTAENKRLVQNERFIRKDDPWNNEVIKALEKKWLQTRYQLIRWLNTKGPTGRPRWLLLLWLFGVSSVFGSLFLIFLSLYSKSQLLKRKKLAKHWEEALERGLLEVDWKAERVFDVRPPQPHQKLYDSVHSKSHGSASTPAPFVSSEHEAKEMIFDVCVVGGGPSGSSCASHLARGGLRVLLIDRHSFPKDKICGDRWTPLSQLHLESLGLTSFVLNEGLAKWVRPSFFFFFFQSLLLINHSFCC